MHKLIKTGVSITFITSENVRSPWIYYEAGVISAKNEDCLICPYLIGVEPKHVRDTPLGQFQCTLANATETFRLIRSIDEALDVKAHDQHRLEAAFNNHWPELKGRIEDASRHLKPVRAGIKTDRAVNRAATSR